MEEFICICFVVWLGLSTTLSIDSLLHKSRDSTIISKCESAGYYNFKQTRILCSVEKVK